jgi:hypothetical protein
VTFVTLEGNQLSATWALDLPFEEATIYEVIVTYGPHADIKWQFGPYDLFNDYSPFPTDDNVPIDTPVYVGFMRGTADSYTPATLILKPGDEIFQVTAKEFPVASVQLNANITRQLIPDTTYTAILSYSSDTCCIVWEFTTRK